MVLRQYRWSKTYEAGEHELESLLASKDIDAERWDAESDEIFEPHIHPKDKTVWCADGSITFVVNGLSIAMQAGDTLDLPANTVHAAQAGIMGCVCYEFPHINDNPITPVQS